MESQPDDRYLVGMSVRRFVIVLAIAALGVLGYRRITANQGGSYDPGGH